MEGGFLDMKDGEDLKLQLILQKLIRKFPKVVPMIVVYVENIGSIPEQH